MSPEANLDDVRQHMQASTDGMRSAPETVEQQIQRVGATKGPRITPADIEANIAGEFYFTAYNGVCGSIIETATDGDDDFAFKGHLKLLTFCVLVLRNGYTAHGVSACASPENFNQEVGRRVARENAVREMWPLLGYALRNELAKVDER